MKKYNRTIIECVGSCDSDLFKKMIERGDIEAIKVKDAVGSIVDITGYATVHVETDDNQFDIDYYATDDGFISSGSTYFKDGVQAYFGQGNKLKICSVKTKKGSTFKVSPIMGKNNDEE